MSRLRVKKDGSKERREKHRTREAAENSGKKRTIAHDTTPSLCIVLKKKRKSNLIRGGMVQLGAWQEIRIHLETVPVDQSEIRVKEGSTS